MITTLCNCLETSNKLLNTYVTDTKDPKKKELIIKCIKNNADAIIAALEMSEQTQGFEEEAEFIGQFFAIPIGDHSEAIRLLTEVRDSSLYEKDMYKAVTEAIILLTGEKGE